MFSATALGLVPEKAVMDPIHGAVPIFRHELAVIDHPRGAHGPVVKAGGRDVTGPDANQA